MAPMEAPGGATVSDDWSYRGFPALVLENSRLRVTVLPGHGAKVLEFSSKRAGRDLLYHHPRFDVRPPVFGANADDWWIGGIDEIAPTGHTCVIDGEQLPFLGEFWSQPWRHTIDDRGPDRAVVHLWAQGVITPLRIDRWLELSPDSPVPPTWELVYATELDEGWLAVTDPDGGSGIAIAFDPAILPVVWQWGVWGGWRGLYTLAVEPWTAWPARLDQVIEAGRQRTLEPGATLETELRYVAYEGLTSVTSVDRSGRVSGRAKE